MKTLTVELTPEELHHLQACLGAAIDMVELMQRMTGLIDGDHDKVMAYVALRLRLLDRLAQS